MEITFGAAPRLLAVHLYNVPDGVQPTLSVHLPADADPAQEAMQNPDEWQAQTVYDEEPGWVRVEASVPSRVDAWITLDCTLDGRPLSTAAQAGTPIMVRLRGDAGSGWVEPVPTATSQPVTPPQSTATPVQAPQVAQTGATQDVNQAGTEASRPGTGPGARTTTGDTAGG